jgi:hypothetical protein
VRMTCAAAITARNPSAGLRRREHTRASLALYNTCEEIDALGGRAAESAARPQPGDRLTAMEGGDRGGSGLRETSLRPSISRHRSLPSLKLRRHGRRPTSRALWSLCRCLSKDCRFPSGYPHELLDAAYSDHVREVSNDKVGLSEAIRPRSFSRVDNRPSYSSREYKAPSCQWNDAASWPISRSFR